MEKISCLINLENSFDIKWNEIFEFNVIPAIGDKIDLSKYWAVLKGCNESHEIIEKFGTTKYKVIDRFVYPCHGNEDVSNEVARLIVTPLLEK
jgi:hypothetical protein